VQALVAVGALQRDRAPGLNHIHCDPRSLFWQERKSGWMLIMNGISSVIVFGHRWSISVSPSRHALDYHNIDTKRDEPVMVGAEFG
jgi:hypothetical protein